MKTEDFSYFIERYIAGEMSDSEIIWFEKELDGNNILRREVELRHRTEEVLKKQDIITLRNKLLSIEKARKADIPVINSRRKVYLGIAASIAGFIVFGSVIFLSDRNLSTNEIMKRYYTEYQPTSGQRSGGAELNEYFTLGLEYFASHDYKNAALFFSKVVENEPKNMYATLLNGISNFEESRYNDAKKSFGTVIDDNKNLYIDQAQWYLALCFLQTKEEEKACMLLQTIIDEGGLYAKQSKKILKKIK